MPQISVVMACYNAMPYLPSAIDSIRNQSFNDWELIVVNDGSTDTSLEYLLSIANEEPRLRIETQRNQGQQAAANRGIRLATAPLIARMDADDVAPPQRLEKQLAYLNSHPQVGLVGGQIKRMGEHKSGLPSNLPLDHATIVAGLLKNHHTLCNGTILFRKELFDQVGGYWKHNIAEDWDMFLRISDVAQIVNLPDLLLTMRLHKGSINGRRIVEAQLYNEYAASLAICRNENRPEVTFEEFMTTHRSRRWPQSWLFWLDCQSIGQYREAVAELYNGYPLMGSARLILSMLMSPARTMRRLGNMLSKK